MIVQSLASAQHGPRGPRGAGASVLLIATADVGDGELEILLQLGHGTESVVEHLPLGEGAHSSLTVTMNRRPTRVVVVPLATGSYATTLAQVDELVRWAAAWWPDITIIRSASVGTVEQVAAWAALRVDTLLERPGLDVVPRAQTAVLVVNDRDRSAMANAECCAMARLLWERGDYGLVEVAFMGDGERPSVDARMEQCRRLGMRRLVVLPAALLDGAVARAARAHVAMDVVVAGPLLTPRALAAIVNERYRDAIADSGVEIDPVMEAARATDARLSSSTADDILPPRYRGGSAVDPAPMRSAPLLYDAEGRVAWNSIWQSFCNLALAGGPPHRGTLLEPALREDVLGDPEGYSDVASEIARGLSLVTGLTVVTDCAAGWVGMVCPDEEMAIWLLRAITVENVSVRREGATLFVPAGPRYRLEKEIKNVITAVAKTHHYWTEHRTGR